MIASALFPNVASDATARSADAAPASDTQPRATELDDMTSRRIGSRKRGNPRSASARGKKK